QRSTRSWDFHPIGRGRSSGLPFDDLNATAEDHVDDLVVEVADDVDLRGLADFQVDHDTSDVLGVVREHPGGVQRLIDAVAARPHDDLHVGRRLRWFEAYRRAPLRADAGGVETPPDLCSHDSRLGTQTWSGTSLSHRRTTALTPKPRVLQGNIVLRPYACNSGCNPLGRNPC